MKKVLIFGAGRYGKLLQKYLEEHLEKYQFVGFLDNQAEKVMKGIGGGVWLCYSAARRM